MSNIWATGTGVDAAVVVVVDVVVLADVEGGNGLVVVVLPVSVFWIDVLVTGRGGRLVVLVRVPKFTFGTGSAASTSEVTLAEGELPRGGPDVLL